MQAPKPTLPASFEQYNVKTTESINTSAAGISGYRQFEYPFIARAEGTYEVEPVEFSYFDPSRMQYMTLKSKALELEITPDAKGGGDALVVQGRGMSKEEVKLLGQDIRFIKLGSPQLRSVREPFLFSAAYWVLFFGILILFAMVYVALRRQIRESQNVALLRGQSAPTGRRAAFPAPPNATWRSRTAMRSTRRCSVRCGGYMSDKFNIPVANLTKENVRVSCTNVAFRPEEPQRFTAIITKCDEAQYSPAASARMTECLRRGRRYHFADRSDDKTIGNSYEKNEFQLSLSCCWGGLASYAQEPADSLCAAGGGVGRASPRPGPRPMSCGTWPTRPISAAISIRPPKSTKRLFPAG